LRTDLAAGARVPFSLSRERKIFILQIQARELVTEEFCGGREIRRQDEVLLLFVISLPR
jgi:hypothetical protein